MYSTAFFSVGFIISFFATQVASYIIMGSPVFYNNNTLNNSPLNVSGSDYPYK